jgi:exodeoxyribonuclease VII large subunit
VAAARQHVDQLGKSRVMRVPHALVLDLSRRLDELEQQATRALGRRVERSRDRLAAITCRLDALSPLAVLRRGYSVTTDGETGRVLTNAVGIRVGQRIRSQLVDGWIVSRVELSGTGNGLSNGAD